MHVVTSDETRPQAGDSSDFLMWALGVDMFDPARVLSAKIVGHRSKIKSFKLGNRK